MTTKLYAPARSSPGRRTWCGPYAIAVALGVDYDEAYAKACRILRKRCIAGMWNSQITFVLKALGKSVITSEPRDYVGASSVVGGFQTRGVRARKYTLSQFLKAYAHEIEEGATYIVNAGRHYVVVKRSGSHLRIIDNQQPQWKGITVRKGAGSYKRARVQAVIKVEDRA